MQNARMVLTREYVEIPVDGRAMRTFVAAPRDGGPHPGIAFYSDIFQLTEPTLRWCVRLAGYGFVVAAPEIYHRREPAGTVLEFDDKGKARGQHDAEQTPVADFDADIAAALAWLAEHSSGSLGAAGHCTGGHLAFRAALNPDVVAAACFYATDLHKRGLGKGMNDDTLARCGQISAEMLMIWGKQDPHISCEGRSQIYDAMADAKLNFTWHEFNAQHAFLRDEGPRYDPALARLTLGMALDLFQRLKCPPSPFLKPSK